MNDCGCTGIVMCDKHRAEWSFREAHTHALYECSRCREPLTVGECEQYVTRYAGMEQLHCSKECADATRTWLELDQAQARIKELEAENRALRHSGLSPRPAEALEVENEALRADRVEKRLEIAELVRRNTELAALCTELEGKRDEAKREAKHYEDVAQAQANELESKRAMLADVLPQLERASATHKRRFRLELVHRREDLPGRPYQFEAEHGKPVYVVPVVGAGCISMSKPLPENVQTIFLTRGAEFGPAFELVPAEALDVVGR